MRNEVTDIYLFGRVTKAFLIHKWRKLGTVVNFPRSGQPTKITLRVHRQLTQEVTKEPRIKCKELQTSLASVKVIVYDSTIRKRLGIHGRVPRRKSLLTKNNIKSHICPKTSWRSPRPLRTSSVDRQNFLEVCVLLHDKTNTAFHKNIIPTVKHLVVVLSWSGATLLGQDLDDWQ